MASWNDLPQMGAEGWHARWGGRQWRFDGTGVYIDHKTTPERTPGTPDTVRAIAQLMGGPICRFCVEFWIPAELVIMTIATETAAYKKQGFTGPTTFRWEDRPGVPDVGNGSETGTYSAGPMQYLATVARNRIRRDNLPVAEPFEFAPHYRDQPNVPPADLPIYDYRQHLMVGIAELAARQQRLASDDPVLTAAKWNAGGLYQSSKNAWHIRCYGNHLDRAVRWYGDACAVLKELRGA